MKPTRLAILLATLGLLSTHCGPKAGIIGPAGFAQETYHYRVDYRDSTQKLFISSDWQLDNYYFDTALNNWKPKAGPAYQAIREFDADGDGTISESEKRKEFIYDLRFTHAKDDGIIWIKAHPVAASDARRDLDVELSDYADGMAGTGLYAQGNLFSLERVKARTYTTFVTSKQAIKVGALSGIVGEIELAEIDKLRFDPKDRAGKLKVVLARFTFQQRVTAGFDAPRGGPNAPLVVWRDGVQYVEKPALLIAGYYNTMAKFQDHVKDFDDMLGQLALTVGSSPVGETATSAPATSSAAAPSASAKPNADGGR